MSEEKDEEIRLISTILESFYRLIELGVFGRAIGYVCDKLECEFGRACMAVELQRPQTLEEVERMHVMRTLGEAQQVRAEAARSLGMSRRSLIRLLDKYKKQGEYVKPSPQMTMRKRGRPPGPRALVSL